VCDRRYVKKNTCSVYYNTSDVGCGGKAHYDRKAWGVQESSFKSLSQPYKGRERAVLDIEAAEVKYAALKERGIILAGRRNVYESRHFLNRNISSKNLRNWGTWSLLWASTRTCRNSQHRLLLHCNSTGVVVIACIYVHIHVLRSAPVLFMS